MLDLVDWLLGPLERVKGLAARVQQEEEGAAAATGNFSSTAVEDNVHLVFATPGESRRVIALFASIDRCDVHVFSSP